MPTAHDILVPKFLSQNEFDILCDVFNGTYFNDGFPIRTGLVANVRDAIVMDSIHEKWNVDPELLLNKLDKFNELNFVLVYAIMEFWHKLDLYINAEVRPDHFAVKKAMTVE